MIDSIVWLVLLVAFLVVEGITVGLVSSWFAGGALAALLLGALALARFALLGNHSYLHEFFTYRALCATVMAVLTAFVLNIRLPQKEVGP